MDHVGIVVHDLKAAIDFFGELGLAPVGQGSVGGSWVERIIGLENVRVQFAMMQTPDGNGKLELIQFESPPHDGETGFAPANVPGIRHIAFLVDDIDASIARLRHHGAELVGEVVRYENMYRLCYVRGPAGIIIELAQAVR